MEGRALDRTANDIISRPEPIESCGTATQRNTHEPSGEGRRG